MSIISSVSARPGIILTMADHDRLSSVANAAAHSMPDRAADLSEELERAQIVPEAPRPLDFVCMGCVVDFRDVTSDRIMTVTLVYPNEADISKRRVSELTPIGTALLGLPVGASIDWTTRNGELKRLTVLQVRTRPLVELEPA